MQPPRISWSWSFDRSIKSISTNSLHPQYAPECFNNAIRQTTPTIHKRRECIDCTAAITFLSRFLELYASSSIFFVCLNIWVIIVRPHSLIWMRLLVGNYMWMSYMRIICPDRDCVYSAFSFERWFDKSNLKLYASYFMELLRYVKNNKY